MSSFDERRTDLDPVRRVIRATGYSIQGLAAAWRTQPALRYECVLLALVIPAALWFGRSGLDRALLIGSWLMVILCELINSAIETIVDRIGVEDHELSGRAKDLGSATVFMALVIVGVVWLFVLTQP